MLVILISCKRLSGAALDQSPSSQSQPLKSIILSLLPPSYLPPSLPLSLPSPSLPPSLPPSSLPPSPPPPSLPPSLPPFLPPSWCSGGSSLISSSEQIEAFRKTTGCSSVMVARAAQWNPSVFR